MEKLLKWNVVLFYFFLGSSIVTWVIVFKHQQIRVEEQEDDFLIKVFTTRNCQGLLVFILEAFEELGLEVLQARISASDSFILEAIATRV